ncbi:MAG: non-heme iron oxygenase ferredoxin subunit [Gammaproteobacteria bacterium]
MTSGDWIEVAAEADFVPGSRRVVHAQDTAIAVFNVGGHIYAVEDICTHDAAPIAEGMIDGTDILCPRHGARFCLRTGAALTPPAYEPIACFPVKVDSGRILVRDDRWD